jgi:hypothetical protein
VYFVPEDFGCLAGHTSTVTRKLSVCFILRFVVPFNVSDRDFVKKSRRLSFILDAIQKKNRIVY